MTVRTQQITGPMSGIKTLLAASDSFNTFIGRESVDEAIAAASIHYFSTTGTAAQALLWPEDYESAGLTLTTFTTDTLVILRLERETPTDELGDSTNEQAWSFLQAAEAVIDELKTDVAGRLDRLNISNVTLSTAPHMVDFEDSTDSQIPFWLVEFVIQVTC